ncbi:MAG: sugar phosphate isomerase/epimerase [Terriglobia bacterium]
MISRRAFCQSSIGAAVSLGMGKGVSKALIASPLPESIRLGGLIFSTSQDPEELARVHKKLGYRAAYCPKASAGDSSRLTAIEKAFAAEGIVIAEVGRWVNLMDADNQKRRANLEYVTDGLAVADQVGALCCVDIAGSMNPTVWYGPHPDNLSPAFFDAAVENARKIIDAVKPRRARFCYEMMGWTVPDSPDNFLKLLKAVDREAFAVHLDPCNIVNSPIHFYRNTELLNECFEKLGPWIVSCHAKDLSWEPEYNIHFREVRPGTGSLDYRTYLKRLAALPHHPPLMLEHLPNAEEYDRARLYLFELGNTLGIEIRPPSLVG